LLLSTPFPYTTLFRSPVLGANTDNVLWLPAAKIRVIASATKTTISNVPRATPVRVERRMPRYVSTQTMRPATTANGAHSQSGQPDRKSVVEGKGEEPA